MSLQHAKMNCVLPLGHHLFFTIEWWECTRMLEQHSNLGTVLFESEIAPQLNFLQVCNGS